MVEIIGQDDTYVKDNVQFTCKCEACGCIFHAGLDDATLGLTTALEYQLMIRCPKCSNSLSYICKE